MTIQVSYSTKRIMYSLLVIAFVLALVSIGGKYVEAAAGTEQPHPISQFVRVMNINRESTVPTWYATLLLLASSLLFGTIAIIKRGTEDGRALRWFGLMAIFLFLSIDENAAIHEKFTIPLQEALQPTHYLWFAWIIAAIPLVILFFIVYARLFWNLPQGVRLRILGALGLYILATIGIESIGANKWYNEGGSSLSYSTIGTIEEFLEMAAIIILIDGLLMYLGILLKSTSLEINLRHPAIKHTPQMLLSAPLPAKQKKSRKLTGGR